MSDTDTTRWGVALSDDQKLDVWLYDRIQVQRPRTLREALAALRKLQEHDELYREIVQCQIDNMGQIIAEYREVTPPRPAEP